MEHEQERPACWFGRVCPYKLVEQDEDVTEAYRFTRFAVTLDEKTDPKTKAKTQEWVTNRESVQWACWLHALETREDRLAALELVSIVGVWSRRGQEWDTLRTLARANVEGGEPSATDIEILQVDEDLE